MIYIIMGVSGTGKSRLVHRGGWAFTVIAPNYGTNRPCISSLGVFLSEKLDWPLHEGDNFHPLENIEKMTRGEPLTDQDRWPWLLKLHEVIERERSSGFDALVVCSALKRQYRQILLYGSTALSSSTGPHQEILPSAAPDVFFLYLHGDYNIIYQRMVARKGHYMTADLLRSQFDVLEPPSDEENVLPLDISRSIADMVGEVEKHINSVKSSSVVKS